MSEDFTVPEGFALLAAGLPCTGGFAGSKVCGLEMLGGFQFLSAAQALVRSGFMNKTTVAGFLGLPDVRGWKMGINR